MTTARRKTLRQRTDDLDRELREEGYGLYLKKAEVADLVRRCTRTVELDVANGLLRVTRRRGHPLFRRREVARFLCQNG